MLKARATPYTLNFNFEARTSRASMTTKDTYFVEVYAPEQPERKPGIGECALFRGLSAEDSPDYESFLADACENPEATAKSHPYSSIRFGFETAMADFASGGDGCWVHNDWSDGLKGIPINGLIWMGDKALMRARIAEKLDAGFRVLKLKIGGIDFEDELDLLRIVRGCFGPESLEIRLDANGSFTAENAQERLDRLSRFDIHSLEQPLRAGQWEATARLCAESPVAIALDEELIGMRNNEEQAELLDSISPRFIILKPALCGGLARANAWIEQAAKRGIGWWATSALESNIGLNAIAQWVTTHQYNMPQGLGTGQLYSNNIPGRLVLRGSELFRDPAKVL